LSGRRAKAVYALLLRDVAAWDALYANPQVRWGDKAVQIMLDTLGYAPGHTDGTMDGGTHTALRNFQTDQHLGVTGNNDAATRNRLFRVYMDDRCHGPGGAAFQLAKADFLARGADKSGKGDLQGCSEFNPVLVFSKAEDATYQKAADKTARDLDNAPNRRVVASLFKPGTKVDPGKWPCPTITEPTEGCRARFWSDGNARRAPQAARRRFDDTHDTFACRFYHRIATFSPCEFGDLAALAVVRFLDNTNTPIPGSQSLPISNFVTNDQLPVAAATTFATAATDLENFRFEVVDPAATKPVQASLQVLRLSAKTAGPFTYTLIPNAPAGGLQQRSLFLRLVSDTDDDAASGNAVNSDPDNQTILVRLGDVVRATYQPATGPAARVELAVGLPRGENNNGANTRLHDIREIRVNVTVFQLPGGGGPVKTRAQVQADLGNVNERMAQSCIRLNIVNINMGGAGDPGVALPAALTGGFTQTPGIVNVFNAQEQAVIALKDANPNTVDIFYIDQITNVPTATSYPTVRNATGNAAANNFVVTSVGANVFSLAHELMHILLNSPHRPNEPPTSLFRGGTTPNKSVGGTKRIGPYPQAAAAGVGNNDTTTIRNSAETLP
jgi:hypothetical protein